MTAALDRMTTLATLAAAVTGAPYAVARRILPSGQTLTAAAGLSPSSPLVAQALAQAASSAETFPPAKGPVHVLAAQPFFVSGDASSGLLCVFDTVPRPLTPDQREALERLGAAASRLLEADPEGSAPRRLEEGGALLPATLLDGIGEAVLVVDAAWRLTYLNVVAAQFSPEPRAALLGRSLWEVAPETVGTIFEAKYREARATGQTTEFEAYSEKLQIWVWVKATPYAGGLTICFQDVSRDKDLLAAQQVAEADSRQLFEQAAEGIAYVSLDGRWMRVNPPLCSMLGYSSEELGALTFLDLTHPEDVTQDRACRDAMLRGDCATVTREKRYLKKDGAVVWVESAVSLIRSPDGQPRHFISIIRDVTERRRTEAALQQANARLSQVLESISDGFLAVDNAWRLTYINPVAARLSPLPRERLLGQSFWEVSPSSVGTLFDMQIRRAKASGEPVSFEAYSDAYNRWFSMRAYPHPEGLSVFFQDVTEQKELQHALHRSSQELQLTFDLAAEGIAQISLDGRWLRVNPRLCTMLGYHRDEMLAMRFQDVTPAEEVAQDLENIERLRSGEIASYTREKHYQRRDGTLFWVRVTVSLLRDAQNVPQSLIAVVSDIDAQKQTADLLQQQTQLLRASEADFRRQAAVLQSILESIAEGVAVVDASGRLIHTNPAARWLTDLTLSPDQPAHWPAEMGLYEPDRVTPLPAARIPLLRALRGEVVDNVEMYIAHPALAQARWINVNARPLRSEEGVVTGAVAVWRDVTAQKIADEKLHALQANLLKAQEIAHLGSWEWDLETDALVLSDEMYRIFGRQPSAGVERSRTFWNQVHPEDLAAVEEAVAQAVAGWAPYDTEMRIVRPDGEIRHVAAEAEISRDAAGRPLRMVGTLQDISERKALELRLIQLAHYDPLTGVANRTLLREHLEKAIARARRRETRIALLYLDLDRFKQVNDTYGHAAGDAVLQAFAQRLEGCVRAGDRVGRLGGDEFAILLEDLHDVHSAVTVARKILAAMETPVSYGDLSLTLGASVGIALHQPGMELDALVKAADWAMIQAKQAGRSRYWVAGEKESPLRGGW